MGRWRTVIPTRLDRGRGHRKAVSRAVRQTRRLFILGVLIALVVSYIGPIRGYQSRKTELRAQQVTLSKLLKERDALRAQVAGGQSKASREQRARELGFIKPGERQFRVNNIEPDPTAAPGSKGIGSWLPPVA